MANVTFKNVKKVFEKNAVAVEDFSLEVKDKEFVVLVGPSGCGKSTTLRMVAGLEEMTDGDIYIGDRLVNSIPPKDRDIAMVFQNYALYPHLTVYENLAFSLKLRKLPKAEIEAKVNAAADILEIRDLLKRKPKALSGGQRQRVAIGRAIVREPKVFLMDEPLSNLDAKLRNQMRTELIKLRQRINTTFIYVTHDQTEAMTLGDRIVVMKDGIIQQIGAPFNVFNKPVNKFVAGFIGMPQMNFMPGKLVISGGKYAVQVYGAEYILPDNVQVRLQKKSQAQGDVTVGIRPEHIKILPGDIPNCCIKARVDVSELMGSEVYLHVVVEQSDVVIRVQIADIHQYTFEPGKENRVYFTFPGDYIHLFDIETMNNIIYDSQEG
jgi:multiple sugar transport system ATP-binding protein